MAWIVSLAPMQRQGQGVDRAMVGRSKSLGLHGWAALWELVRRAGILVRGLSPFYYTCKDDQI